MSFKEINMNKKIKSIVAILAIISVGAFSLSMLDFITENLQTIFFGFAILLATQSALLGIVMLNAHKVTEADAKSWDEYYNRKRF